MLERVKSEETFEEVRIKDTTRDDTCLDVKNTKDECNSEPDLSPIHPETLDSIKVINEVVNTRISTSLTSLEEDDARMINNNIDIHYSQLSVKKSIENMIVSLPNSNIHNDGKAEVINDIKDIVPDIDSAFAFKVCSEEDNLGRWLYTAGVISTNLRSNILSDTEKSTGEKDEVELIKVTTKDDIEKYG